MTTELAFAAVAIVLLIVNVIGQFYAQRSIPLSKVHELVKALQPVAVASPSTLDDRALELFEKFLAWYEDDQLDELDQTAKS